MLDTDTGNCSCEQSCKGLRGCQVQASCQHEGRSRHLDRAGVATVRSVRHSVAGPHDLATIAPLTRAAATWRARVLHLQSPALHSSWQEACIQRMRCPHAGRLPRGPPCCPSRPACHVPPRTRGSQDLQQEGRHILAWRAFKSQTARPGQRAAERAVVHNAACTHQQHIIKQGHHLRRRLQQRDQRCQPHRACHLHRQQTCRTAAARHVGAGRRVDTRYESNTPLLAQASASFRHRGHSVCRWCALEAVAQCWATAAQH
jgi:hypothetical protein